MGAEQVDLSILLDNAHEELTYHLLSASARLVVWDSFSDSADILFRQYFEAKGRLDLCDRRRSRERFLKEDRELLEIVEWATENAEEYIKWSRNRDRQPIFWESLVSICYAFEHCLRTIALVFWLARDNKKSGIAYRVFVPGDKHASALRQIDKSWRIAGNSEGTSRLRSFFDENIFKQNPAVDQYPFVHSQEQDNVWGDVEAAYKLRNAIVHQGGRLSEAITFAGEQFHPRDYVSIQFRHLKRLSGAVERLVHPISPFRVDLL